MRPTVKQVQDAVQGVTVNPFTSCGADYMIPQVNTMGPTLAAELEYAFPGAKWAPLGRDSSFAGDILEAFALHFGQDDRVVRLNASGPSFGNSEHYAGLLYSADLIDEKNEPLTDFIILDPTSWSDSSQIRRLISSVYHGKSEARRIELLRSVNAVALSGGGKAGGAYGVRIATGTPDQVLNHPTFNSDGTPRAILSTVDGLSYPASPCGGGEMSWHDSFTLMHKTSKGKFVAPPGRASPQNTREHILWRMFELLRLTETPEYQKAAVDYASKLGFDLNDSMLRNYGASGGIELPESGSELETVLLEMLKSRKSKTFQREFRKAIIGLPDRIIPIFNLKLDLKVLRQVVSMMSAPTQKTFYWEAISRTEDLDRAIELVRMALDDTGSEHLKIWVKTLMSQKPTIEQMNKIAKFAYQDKVTTESFLEDAFGQIQTREEYKKLNKPTIRTKAIRAQIKEFKKAHPKAKGNFLKTIFGFSKSQNKQQKQQQTAQGVN